ERRLARSAPLREELRALRQISAQIEALHRQAEPAEAPDLWSGIAAALPAIDAQLAEERAGRAPYARPPEAPPRHWLRLPGWAVGTAALAAAAAVALVVVVGPPSGGPAPGSERPIVAPGIAPGGGVVRYLDSGGASVMVIEDAEADMTIIWMMEAV
ncbi:MAG: hypothetical protein VX681_13320, partial [Myxococcota bacterium]|nr:hypothetical protein [Myxococcota bacterium]